MSEECIFCKIVSGEIPSHKVYEDEEFLAFLDVNPKSCGHTLVIPKKHYRDIFDIPDNVLKELMGKVKEISEMIENSDLNPAGIQLLQSNGRAAGQEVFHFHVHIIPGYDGALDSREGGDLERVAEKIRG